VAVVKADQRARGRYLGGIIPFGYAVAVDGALEAQPDQQAAVARMRELRLAGGSLRSIAAEMRLAGHPLLSISVE
jgi:putative DNA-invertase from lambdoid prophage Rac